MSLRLPGQGTSEESDLLVWVTLGVALLLGVVLQFVVVSATTTVAAPGVQVAYPASWLPQIATDGLVAAADPRGGSYGQRVRVEQRSKDALVGATLGGGGSDAEAAATALSFERGRSLIGYQLLDQRGALTTDGQPAARVEYVYLEQGASALAGGRLPGLMRAVDLVTVRGDRVWILTGGVETSGWNDFTQPRFPQVQSTWDAIAGSWRTQ